MKGKKNQGLEKRRQIDHTVQRLKLCWGPPSSVRVDLWNMGHSSDKQSWSLLWSLDPQRLVWLQLISNTIIPLKAIAASVPLHSVMSAQRLQPLRRCDSTEVGDRWVAPARASPEVSRSLSLWGSPATGHLLPAFPSLFISGRHAIPLPVKVPPLPPPHLHPSSAEFGTAPPNLAPTSAA